MRGLCGSGPTWASDAAYGCESKSLYTLAAHGPLVVDVMNFYFSVNTGSADC